MWVNLAKALLAVLAFVIFPFLVIAASAGLLALLGHFSHFLLTHRHQH